MTSRCAKFTTIHSATDRSLRKVTLLGKCLFLSALLTQLSAQVTVDMSQYNYERTGANLQEWNLHPSNVNPTSFGKLFSRSVDASVYALPLIVPNVPIAGGAPQYSVRGHHGQYGVRFRCR